MRTLRSSIARTALAAAAAATVFAPVSAMAQTAESGAATAKVSGLGLGYNNVMPDGTMASEELVVVEDGDTIATFCVQYGVDTDYEGTYVSSTWAAHGLPNGDKVAFIAVNHNEIGTPLEDAKLEAVAAQLAIWKLTDNLDYSEVDNKAARDRADALAANGGTLAEGPSSFNLSVTAERGEGTATATATVTLADDAGTGIAGQAVTVTAGDDTQQATTGADGTATVELAAGPDAVTVDATWDGVLPEGTLLESQVGQAKITTAPAPLSRAASVELDAAPAPTTTTTTAPPTTTTAPPTTEPPTTAPPTTAPPVEQPPAELPYTGTTATVGMAAVAAAASAGGYWLRKRGRV